MKILNDTLQGRTPNAMLPFLWVHGTESEQALREEVRRIHDSGMGAFCVEARPHKDFGREGWFRDLALLLEEAKKNGMKMWVLDDSHFPTGYADGAVKRDHPELCKKFLCCKTFDFVGPMQDAGAILKYVLSSPQDTILAVILTRKTAFETLDAATAVDLTDKVVWYPDGRTGKPMCDPMGNELPGPILEGECPAVDFDLPEGAWSLNVLTVSYKGGEKQTEGYLNPLLPEATKVLLDTVYEPIYAHFKDEFGKTFCGFFSDEPRFGNIHGAEDAAIGRNSAMNLPWCDGLEDKLAAALQNTKLAAQAKTNIRTLLPLLFLHSTDDSAHVVQYTYMDMVSRMYSDNFDGVLADWCHAHGCEHIGHTIEDNNASSRLGYGAGHIYRAMKHQDMAGIDVVIQQLLPGQDAGLFKGMHAPGWDGEFFTYMLGKLGSSLAHLDPKKQGRCMCELFGAYGWNEGNRLCKWLADYMLVRGVNHFVPHAFDAAPFPDADCPPHFYAHGHNPQFPEFRLLAGYMNRLAAVLGGTHVAPVALLYQAEAEWSGDYMPTQRPAGELARHGIDYEIVPCDYLTDTAAESVLNLNGMAFKALVIPYAEALPAALLAKLKAYSAAGIKIYFVDALPTRCCEGGAAELPQTAKVVPLAELADVLAADGVPKLHLSSPAPALRYYHARQTDGDVYFFTNEGTTPLHTTVTGAVSRPAFVYDAFANALTQEDDPFTLDLAPYTAKCIVIPDDAAAFGTVAHRAQRTPTEKTALNVPEVRTADADTCCTVWSEPFRMGQWQSLHKLPQYRAFAGRIRYTLHADLIAEQAAKQAQIVLNGVQEGAIVRVNGKDCGTRICAPYTYAVTDALIPGDNTVEIEVNTTLGRRMNDFLSQYLLLEPLGITGGAELWLF